jgi:multiple sugar transport system permease protein
MVALLSLRSLVNPQVHLVIGQSNNLWSVQVDISAFITSQAIILHEVFMGALVAIFPVVIVFLVLQHFIVEGATLSGVKG